MGNPITHAIIAHPTFEQPRNLLADMVGIVEIQEVGHPGGDIVRAPKDIARGGIQESLDGDLLVDMPGNIVAIIGDQGLQMSQPRLVRGSHPRPGRDLEMSVGKGQNLRVHIRPKVMSEVVPGPGHLQNPLGEHTRVAGDGIVGQSIDDADRLPNRQGQIDGGVGGPVFEEPQLDDFEEAALSRLNRGKDLPGRISSGRGE